MKPLYSSMNNVYDNKRTPINKTAALVISKGTHYEPDCKIQVKEFDSPPMMLDRRHFPKNPNFVDLTGKEKGRFRVVGLLAGSKLNQWVVRCSCGKYTTRTTKSIKSVDLNESANFDACRECKHLAFLKRNEHWRRTGKDLPASMFW